MRPAACASVMRNRKPQRRRPRSGVHTFSWQRFFLLLIGGLFLFIPGLVVTIIGIYDEKDADEDKMFYHMIGPGALAAGSASIVGSGLYYCCWGVQSPVNPRHVRKHKKTADSSADHYDPLQAFSGDKKNSTSIYTNHRDSRSIPGTPDTRSASRHGNGHHRYRTTSRTSVDSHRSHHHQNSRHRSNSHNHSGGSRANSRSHSPRVSHKHHPPPAHTESQVAFINTTAPLAQQETASVDISIDIEPDILENKKY